MKIITSIIDSFSIRVGHDFVRVFVLYKPRLPRLIRVEAFNTAGRVA
jgi:hypothetical protein